jgi:hypothetical protein
LSLQFGLPDNAFKTGTWGHFHVTTAFFAMLSIQLFVVGHIDWCLLQQNQTVSTTLLFTALQQGSPGGTANGNVFCSRTTRRKTTGYVILFLFQIQSTM